MRHHAFKLDNRVVLRQYVSPLEIVGAPLNLELVICDAFANEMITGAYVLGCFKAVSVKCQILRGRVITVEYSGVELTAVHVVEKTAPPNNLFAKLVSSDILRFAGRLRGVTLSLRAPAHKGVAIASNEA